MAVYLYKIRARIGLSLGNNPQNRNWNQPMDQCDFKVFTGVDNKIEFQVRDLDRRPLVLDSQRLQAVIADRYTKVVLATVYLDPLNTSKGLFELKLTRAQTIDWPVASHAYNVLLEDTDGSQTLLFLDQNQQHRGFLECLPSLLDNPSIEDSNDYDFPLLPANLVNTFRIRLDLDANTSLQDSTFRMQIRTSRNTGGALLADLDQSNGGLNLVYDNGQPYLDLRFGPFPTIQGDTTLFYEIVVNSGAEQSVLLQGNMPVEAGVLLS